MAKSYSEQLGEWVELRKSPRRDRNLVAFLAVRDDVKTAIDDGYTIKTVWTNMHEAGRIEFGYHTFRNYAKKHLGAPAGGLGGVARARMRTNMRPTKGVPLAPEPDGQKQQLEGAAGFTFNAAPNKEELL